MWVIFNKKWIIYIIIITLFVSCVFAVPLAVASTPKTSFTIVIDAGHGGIDGGSVGKTTGKDENYINLQYALCLKKVVEKYNIKVVLTRSNLNGLYNPFSTNKKFDDMQKREEIIKKSNADLVVSIHMNSFPLSSCKGAQVFFANDNIPSKN